MDRKRANHWGAILGLVTAILALLTAYFALQEKWQAVEDKKQQQAASDAEMKRQQELYEKQRQADIAAQQAMLAAQAAAQQHASICQGHQTNMAAIQSRFSDLMASHGVLMNFVKGCIGQKAESDQQSCLATVCVGAILISGSNCATIGTDAAAIKSDWDMEKQSATTDQCEVSSSSIDSFFKQ